MIDKNLKERVKQILIDIPITKDCDRELCFQYYTKHIFKKDSGGTLDIYNAFTKTPTSSIGRARRELQEHNCYLRGELYGVRKDRAKLFRAHYSVI